MDNYFNYSKLLNEVTLLLVKKVLKEVEEKGLPGDHHFFISINSNAPRVELSQRLKLKFPNEITIVLQYQFEDLCVYEDKFSVRLSFYGIKEVIVVPFNAIISFTDPSVGFFLTFTQNDIDFLKWSDQELYNCSDLGSEVIDLMKFKKNNK